MEAYHARPDDPLTEQALLGTFADAPGFMGYRAAPFGGSVVQGDTIPGTDSAVMASGNHVAVVALDTGAVGPEFDFPIGENVSQSIVRSARTAPGWPTWSLARRRPTSAVTRTPT